MAKQKVFVTVPKRKDWPSYWFLRKEFAPGSYELEVDDDQLERLKADPVIVLSFSPPATLKISAEHVEAAVAEQAGEVSVGRKLKVSKTVR